MTTMSRKPLAAIWLLAVLALAGIDAALASRPGGGPELEIAVAEECPVRILEHKTWLASSLTRDPWAVLRGTESPPAGRSTYGAGESSLVFNVGFRNLADQDVRAVGLLWQALDSSGEVVYQWISIYSQSPVEPGDGRTLHELNVEAPTQVASYRLSVIQVNLGDGTIWSGVK